MAKAAVIRRGYAGAAGRQIHYRIAGSGPPLILFHQSPRSSAEYVPLIEQWAEFFTVIAPDTPGYGASDPLAGPEVPEMPDFAAAMEDFLDNIGVERAAIYGFHTGASLVVALAARAPAKVAVAVANGLALLEPQERDDILQHYLPDFEAAWDGSHLAWLWARMREQVIFFPWYDRRNETRLSYAMREPGEIDAQILDMLWAGDHYAAAYRAAFTFDRSALARVRGPLTVMAAPTDPLAGHLDRLGDLLAAVTIDRPESREAVIGRALEVLMEAELADAPPLAESSASGAEISRGYVGVAGGGAQIHYRRAGEAGSEKVFLLHDLYSGSRVLEDEISWLAPDHNVIALDLPGHGQSDDLPTGEKPTPAAYGDWLAEAVEELGAGPVKIIAFGLSAAVALALAERLGDRVRRLVLADSGLPTEAYCDEFRARTLPDLTPNEHGGHLLAGWRFARSGALFWPWFREDIPGIRPIDGDIEPGKLHRRFVALWECRAREREPSPLFFASLLSVLAKDQMRDFPLCWVHAAWASGMEGMEKPWTAGNGDDFCYADESSAARLGALTDALSGG